MAHDLEQARNLLAKASGHVHSAHLIDQATVHALISIAESLTVLVEQGKPVNVSNVQRCDRCGHADGTHSTLHGCVVCSCPGMAIKADTGDVCDKCGHSRYNHEEMIGCIGCPCREF